MMLHYLCKCLNQWHLRDTNHIWWYDDLKNKFIEDIFAIDEIDEKVIVTDMMD